MCRERGHERWRLRQEYDGADVHVGTFSDYGGDERYRRNVSINPADIMYTRDRTETEARYR